MPAAGGGSGGSCSEGGLGLSSSGEQRWRPKQAAGRAPDTAAAGKRSKKTPKAAVVVHRRGPAGMVESVFFRSPEDYAAAQQASCVVPEERCQVRVASAEAGMRQGLRTTIEGLVGKDLPIDYRRLEVPACLVEW